MTVPTTLSDEEFEILALALPARPSWLDLARALETAAEERASDGLRVLSIAFVYDLVPPNQEGRRETAGSPYACMWESNEGSYPPRVAEVKEEVQTLWRSVYDAVDDPIVCARLADLLYVAGGGAAHQEGRRGAQCLQTLAEEPAWTALERAECIARALEVYAELNDRNALSAAAERTVALADELLGQEHAGPPFIALRALVALKPRSRPAELSALLERVIDHFKDSEHEVSALGLAADATVDPKTKQEFRRRQLAARVAEARRAEGIAKVALLQRAAEFARKHALQTEAAALLNELQNIPQSELGLETIEVSTELPTDAIREEIDRLAGSGAEDAVAALRRVGSAIGPPGGSNADIDDEVERQAAEFPIAGLFGQQILGPDSAAPHFVADKPENKRRIARGRQRRLHADFYGGVLIAPMLDEIVRHHGRPSQESVTTHFATDLIGEDRAERIARALELFWDEDYDASAHVLVPRLESIMRDVARHRGITIVKPVTEGSYGGVISLNTVMAKLRMLDPDVEWLDYAEALLCDPLALNLRNDIAHGIVARIGGVHAGLLIHMACFLALLRRHAVEQDDESPSES